mgnify:FL=1|tara:strand:- start:248 stop:412 length:165 start_codon:yes stop_codon:yes gene_type:complete
MDNEITTIQLSSLTNQELDTIQYNNWITSSDEEKDFDVFETACSLLSKTAGVNQ